MVVSIPDVCLLPYFNSCKDHSLPRRYKGDIWKTFTGLSPVHMDLDFLTTGSVQRYTDLFVGAADHAFWYYYEIGNAAHSIVLQSNSFCHFNILLESIMSVMVERFVTRDHPVCHRSASLLVANGDPQDGFFYPKFTQRMDCLLAHH